MNECDSMSAIALSFLAMLIGVWDDDFISLCRGARNRSSLDDGIDVEVLPIYVHYSADVLSQKI